MASLLLVVVDPATFLQFRVPIAIAARDKGYEVHVATMSSPGSDAIRALGFIHHELPLSRSGANPFKEIWAFWSLFRLLRRLNPDIAHFVTIKPVLYGAIAARLANTRGVVVAISGLGRAFIARGIMARVRLEIVSILYRLAFNNRRLAAIFQNGEDLAVIQSMTSHGGEGFFLIDGGSGVNLDNYCVVPEPEAPGTVLFAGRLLRDKGIVEFIEAAESLRARGAEYRFVAVGSMDPGNPATLTAGEIALFEQAGPVEFLGFRSDLPDLIANANVVVLPSYREGFPKVLVEAAASGRAVITTDVPGCRQAIIPEKTGLLIPPKDSVRLAEAVDRLMVSPALRQTMGQNGRAMAEARFDIRTVTGRHLEIYQMLMDGQAA